MKTSRPFSVRSLVPVGALAVLLCASPGLVRAASTNAAPASVSPKASTSTTATDATPPPAPSGANVEKDKDTGKPIVTTPSGLKYVDLAPGTGPAVKTGDEVTVNYVGKLLDGTKFDASRTSSRAGQKAPRP